VQPGVMGALPPAPRAPNSRAAVKAILAAVMGMEPSVLTPYKVKVVMCSQWPVLCRQQQQQCCRLQRRPVWTEVLLRMRHQQQSHPMASGGAGGGRRRRGDQAVKRAQPPRTHLLREWSN
jgi:hypothetical protein